MPELPHRAVFFDDAEAAAIADALRRDGFDARLVREPYAGEDDDEDHPWAVLTDAPLVMLDLVADEFDGWVEHPTPPAASPAPMSLPDAPRTRHRPDAG